MIIIKLQYIIINQKIKLMRKFLCLIWVVLAVSMAYAQKTTDVRPVSTDFPFSQISKEDQQQLEKMVPESARAAQKAAPTRKLVRADGEGEKVEYFVAAQSTTRNYSFVLNGGDIFTYNIGITRDGNKVTFSNFFNLFNPNDYTPNLDTDFSGTYDEASKTITIPTPTVFEQATVCGMIYNYYTGVLACGQLTESGTMIPEDNLVFHVEGDFEKLTTDQAVGVAEYTPSGQSYGLFKSYRKMVICLPKESGDLVCFNETLDLGENFPNTEAVKDSIPLINIGKGDVDFAVEVESDPAGYITSNSGGTIPGLSCTYITFEMAGPEPTDEIEANALINYDTGADDGSLLVGITGKIVPIPDYSAIVKKGEFTFNTSLDYPFEMGEYNGVPAAVSGTKGASGISDLWVRFSVPEGKLGKFSYEGFYKNDPTFRYAWLLLTGYFVDSDAAAYATSDEGDFNGTIEMAPGEHFVRFQHQCSYYSGIESNGLYLTGLTLDLEDLPADAAELKTESIDFGNFLVEDGYNVSGTQNIEIQNRGANPLTLVNLTSDNDEFKADLADVQPATSLQNLVIPITFSSTTSGVKTANITVETSAGTYTVATKAKVFDMPDFSQVVSEGLEYMEISTDPNYPFIVENGVAYNANCDDGDLVEATSSLNIKLNIPEGKIGYLTWEGRTWGAPKVGQEIDYWYDDKAQVEFQCNNNSGWVYLFGQDEDASSDAFCTYSDGYYAKFLTFIHPTQEWFGNHANFQFYQNGDGVTHGKHRFEVKNIRLHVEDFQEHNVELVTEGTVAFEPIYAGTNRHAATTVQLKNTGSATLSVESIEAETEGDPFYGVVPEGWYNQVEFGNTMNVELWFAPQEVSDEDKTYTGNIIIHTTGGDVKVPVEAVALGQKGIIYPGDFEDEGYGWLAFDNDHDGDTWKLGWNLWGDRPEYVLSGHECLGSASADAYGGSYAPDNWTFSPAFQIPAEGAKLSYYISAFHPVRYAEHYSFYIVEDLTGVADGSVDYIINGYQPVIEETIDEPAGYGEDQTKVGGWINHIVDLDSYAGKTIYLAYRHHGCEGQYVLRLDDAFIYTNDKYNELGISTLSHSRNVESEEIYNLSGTRLDAPAKGVNIIRTTTKDGNVKTQKVIIK